MHLWEWKREDGKQNNQQNHRFVFLLGSSLSLSYPLPLIRNPSIRGRREVKTERAATNQSTSPAGTGFCGWRKKKEKHFNLLAVNMPTAAGRHTLSRGDEEEPWNYYEFGGDCEWWNAEMRKGVCVYVHVCGCCRFSAALLFLPSESGKSTCHVAERHNLRVRLDTHF